MRMSLAGPAVRGPYPQSQSGPGTAPRQSIYRSQNVNPLLQSTSKPNYGRTPLSSSTRRGSIWGGASVIAPSSGQTVKDTRPLRERPYQVKMRQDIFSWLHPEYDISMQTLVNITGKDFRAIFYHLAGLLDPHYPFDPKARFEDEFVPALRALRYPFASQIDNKWLAAPASMHSWPSLLGVLHWLVEMSKAREHCLNSGHRTFWVAADVPEEFDDPYHHQALALDYYSDAYGLFLLEEDAFPVQDQQLEDCYKRKNERVAADLDAKKEQLLQAEMEYEKLVSSAAPIVQLEKNNSNLKRDREKFQECLKRYEGRKRALIETIAREKAEIADRVTQLEQLKSEQERLTGVVKTQNLTPEEVVRMKTEQESLVRNLDDLKHKISETNKIVMSLEVNVTNRAEGVEGVLDTYTNLLSSLGLFPPLPPPRQDIDLTLELNTAASDPQQLIIGSSLQKVVRPTLSSVAESKRTQRANVESEHIKVDDELDQLTLECENVDEEILNIEKQVVGLNEQADDLRDATQQNALISNAEATRLEKELAHARTAALANGMGVKSRLQALQFNYREQVEKVARLREDTIRAIVKNSHDIAMFKEEVSQRLRGLTDFAREE